MQQANYGFSDSYLFGNNSLNVFDKATANEVIMSGTVGLPSWLRCVFGVIGGAGIGGLGGAASGAQIGTTMGGPGGGALGAVIGGIIGVAGGAFSGAAQYC